MNKQPDILISPPLLYRSGKIWISEFLSIIIISTLSVIFIALSVKIFINEHRIHSNNRLLKDTRSEYIILTDFEKQLFAKSSIADLLCNLVGNKLPPHVLIDLAELVYDNSTYFGYDPLLLLAVIHVESVFKPEAEGRYRDGRTSGALGLMQLKYATACEVAAQLKMMPISRKDLFRPEINVVLGVAYLTRMISKFKNFKLGILAYNQGPGTIRKHLSESRPLSIQYYSKVLKAYFRFKSLEEKNKRLPFDETLCE